MDLIQLRSGDTLPAIREVIWKSSPLSCLEHKTPLIFRLRTAKPEPVGIGEHGVAGRKFTGLPDGFYQLRTKIVKYDNAAFLPGFIKNSYTKTDHGFMRAFNFAFFYIQVEGGDKELVPGKG